MVGAAGFEPNAILLNCYCYITLSFLNCIILVDNYAYKITLILLGGV